jgi:hypothetical protein
VDLADVKVGLLQGGIPESLVDQLLETYVEQKRRFHLGDHRPQAVEGGRFCEAGFRIVQHECGLAVTPLGKNLPGISDSTLAQFESATNAPDSARFHIPRALKSIYNIRNKRDAAHLADGIDPNLQDATLIMANMDWVLAELVRLHHGVSASEAQQIIEDLVTREVPAVQEIAGQPVILTDLQPRDQALLMLYRVGAEGATIDELLGWLPTTRRDHLRNRLKKLQESKLVHMHANGNVYLTIRGMREVEDRNLAQPM